MKEGWKILSLRNCCEILDSKRVPITKSKREKGDVPYYGATGLQDYVKDYLFDEPLVLLGEDGAKWGAGENSAYKIDGKSWVNNHAHVLRPKRDLLKDEWLIYFLNYSDLQGYITGVTVPKLNQEKMGTISIPVPSLSDQQSIVEYLDSSFAKIDAMKVNAEKALSEAKALSQASLKSLLEPKDGWEKKTLLDVVDENSSISYGIVQPGDDVPNGVPVVRPVDLTSKNITLTNQIKRTAKENSDAYRRTILKGKEILLCVRGTTGVISMTDESLKDCNVTRGLVPLRITDDTLRNFLYFALLAPIASDFIQHNTRGAALKQINIADVKLVPVYLPSSNEQQSIVNTLETVENKVIQLQSNYDQICKECDALKQALLKQVFE